MMKIHFLKHNHFRSSTTFMKSLDKVLFPPQLQKAMYGLRQAPRAGYVELSTFLVGSGIKNSTTDASLFTYCHKNIVIYFLVYVDDLIMTRNNEEPIAIFVDKLQEVLSLGPQITTLFFGS